MPNHLAGEMSPYLRQHAGNPVDWYPWGETAFTRARSEDRPVFLSIGYAACHWCHVMEKESFENEKIARFLNNNFINIKVDREERPDIDELYMQAIQVMTGKGGWPLTVFLTPEGKPFYGGTYFPPEDRGGLPGLYRVLQTVRETFRDNRSDIDQMTERVAEAILKLEVDDDKKGGSLTADILSHAFLTAMHAFDWNNGGLAGVPKFPQPLVLEFLLRYFARTNNVTGLNMATLTLTQMARGGIYDQLGGGFHRYCVDEAWRIPHFEKMLADNAQLLTVYFHAYLLTGKLLYRQIIENTVDWAIRDMRDGEGGFYSSLDADSEGNEGEYYLWTQEDVAEALGLNIAPIVDKRFGVTKAGNYRGKNVLYVASELPAGMQGIDVQARTALLRHRRKRNKPGRDEKVTAYGNGLMLAALAPIATELERGDYLKVAVANGDFIGRDMIDRGELSHIWQSGSVRINGYLQDYALVINAFIRLHVATLSGKWLKTALTLAGVMVDRFWNIEQGVFFDSAFKTGLFMQPRKVFDESIPSGAAAATRVLLELSRFTDNRVFQDIAARALMGIRENMVKFPLGMGGWLGALDFYLAAPTEIVLAGRENDSGMRDLQHVVATSYLPGTVIAAFDPTDPDVLTDLKIGEGKTPLNGYSAAYICHNHTCLKPITNPVTLRQQIGKLKNNNL